MGPVLSRAPLRTPITRRTGVTLRALGTMIARVALRALGTIIARVALRALRAIIAQVRLVSLGYGIPRVLLSVLTRRSSYAIQNGARAIAVQVFDSEVAVPIVIGIPASDSVQAGHTCGTLRPGRAGVTLVPL